MIITDVTWTSHVNILSVTCNCGYGFFWQSRISLMECPKWKNQYLIPGGHLEYMETFEDCKTRTSFYTASTNESDKSFTT